MDVPDAKICRVCGRRFEWRARWARDWDTVQHCSAGCRRQGLGELDARIEAAVAALAEVRGRKSTFCPSEVARRIAPDDWRPLMERVRQAARRMTHRGELVILQGGRPVDPSELRGPIRLRRP